MSLIYSFLCISMSSHFLIKNAHLPKIFLFSDIVINRIAIIYILGVLLCQQ